jgi:hypothetical protein
MARLYVDENLADLISGLREARHDVVSAIEHGGPGRTDAWHFREALVERRIILTLDKKDFEYFHRLWTTLEILRIVEQGHAGILIAIETKGFAHPDWLPAVQEKLTTPEEVAGRMYRWHPVQERWIEDKWKPEE